MLPILRNETVPVLGDFASSNATIHLTQAESQGHQVEKATTWQSVFSIVSISPGMLYACFLIRIGLIKPDFVLMRS